MKRNYPFLILAGALLASCSNKEPAPPPSTTAPRTEATQPPPPPPAPASPAAAAPPAAATPPATPPAVASPPPPPSPATPVTAAVPTVPAQPDAAPVPPVASTPPPPPPAVPAALTSPPAAPAKPGALEALSQLAQTAVSKPATAPAPAPATPDSTTSGAPNANSLALANLPTDQLTRGLKEALGNGLQHAVAQLGRDGGFLTNQNVKIPMPEKLQMIEKSLRKVGQDKVADEFIGTMNHAAELAVPVAASVFGDSLAQMSVEDAKGILGGAPDAATQYFRRNTEAPLKVKFTPIVKDATAKAGVTAAYKQLLDKASFASAFISRESLDIDSYVTDKALDGLFKMVAEEEKRIRQSPAARTTDLLKSVFGALTK